MTWTDQIGNLLKQYSSGGAAAAPAPDVHAHFDQVAEAAPSSALAEGLSAAFKSDQTPAFGQMLSTMFNNSSGEQKAGIINQIMSSVPPGTLTSLLSGAGLASMLGGGSGHAADDARTGSENFARSCSTTRDAGTQSGSFDRR